MITLAEFLRPDRPVDLPLLMLSGLAEHCQEHDPPISSTPVGDPGRNIPEPDPQFPDRPVQVIGPRPAEFGALLREHAADFVDSFEVAVAEAVQSVTDFGFELEVIQPCSAAHAWTGYRAVSQTQAGRRMNPRGLPGARSVSRNGALPGHRATLARMTGSAWPPFRRTAAGTCRAADVASLSQPTGIRGRTRDPKADSGSCHWEPNWEPTTLGTGLRQAMSGHCPYGEKARQAMSSRPGPPGDRRTTGCTAGAGPGPCLTVAGAPGRRAGRR